MGMNMSSKNHRKSNDEVCLQDLSERYCGDESLIHYACKNNHLKALRELIDSGTDLNVFDDNKLSLLHRMAMEGNFEIGKLLIENGAEIDIKDGKWGSSPLLFAAQAGKTRFVELLLNFGADLNSKSGNGKTALHFASAEGRIDTVKLLLHHGIDINAKTQTGNNCLHYAVVNNRIAITKILISNSVEINTKGADGQTALHHASYEGNIEIMKLLLENGAKVNLLDKDKDTPLHMVIHGSKNYNIDAIKLLIDHGADFRLENAEGQSILQLCQDDSDGKDILDVIWKKSLDDLKEDKPIEFTLENCVICDIPRNEIFALDPCGHAKVCEFCCIRLLNFKTYDSVCPICRDEIISYKKIYI